MKTFRQLQEEYNKHGISLVCARNKQKYFLTIKNVPYTVQGIKSEQGICQLTGYYIVYCKETLQDVEVMTDIVFNEYKKQYANNEIMLSYVQ